MTKADLKARVLRHVISLEVSKGHLKWKVTDLSRLSKVSRPSIYYHFGKTKKAILETSFNMLVEDVYGFSAERTSLVKEGDLLSSIRRTQRLFMENPEYGIIYIKWRSANSPMRASYLAIEKRYQDRLRSAFPHLKNEEAEALHALLHGIATSPFLSEAGTRKTVEWLKSFLQI